MRSPWPLQDIADEITGRQRENPTVGLYALQSQAEVEAVQGMGTGGKNWVMVIWVPRDPDQWQPLLLALHNGPIKQGWTIRHWGPRPAIFADSHRFDH